MTYIADLSPCYYFPFDAVDRFIAIGWLESGHRYKRGRVSESLVGRLTELLVNPWQPAVTWGEHDCSLCCFFRVRRQFVFNNTTISLGRNNLFLPANGCIFVAPSLIVHYIASHKYSPPAEFVDAVMACPEMRSMAYHDAIRRHAPQDMFSKIKAT